MKRILLTATILLAFSVIYFSYSQLYNKPVTSAKKRDITIPLKVEKDNVANSPADRDYLRYLMLRDPKTKAIPVNARLRELQFARKVDASNTYTLLKTNTTASTQGYTWAQAGPMNIGGRTRALALDITNPQTIIAGGVSGGIWKSKDGGLHWALKSTPDQNLSVTYVAQDPRTTSTWDYSTGEVRGNTAGAHGAFFRGTGVYESTDNGDTWSRIASTKPNNNVEYTSPFQLVSKIIVSPTTGSVFLASNIFGIYRMTSGSGSFQAVLAGQPNQHYYNDVTVNSNGVLLASLSQLSAGQSGTPTQAPGIYISTDDGSTWTNITPSGFPSAYQRTVLAFSPSNPDIAYSYTFDGTKTNKQDDVTFYKYVFNSNGTVSSATDLSANMPNYGGKVGELNTQNNYNMVLAVKPDDPNFVVLGATNLYRSTDGFADTTHTAWIGGYDPVNNISRYPYQHPDQHIAVFNPASPNELYAGCDGGVDYTSDITATNNATEPVTWQSRNLGYFTTQYYQISIAATASDNRIMGGMQDNGTPFYRISTISNPYYAVDVSTGDGGYSYLGSTIAYASNQNGTVYRYSYDTNGNVIYKAKVDPKSASGQLFIDPFQIDPNSETTMYYPAGGTLWRNNAVDQTSQTTNQSNWSIVSGINPPSGYDISALSVSHTPAHVLFVGASDESSSTGKPILYIMQNSTMAQTFTDSVSAPFPAGAYLINVGVNPTNANEFFVVFSNYQIPSIFYTQDGGKTFTNEDGNLNISGLNYQGQTTDIGPSFRCAAIVPTPSGNYYYAGTSTGLYMTTNPSGSSTMWVKQNNVQGGIGDAVVTYLATRTSDNEIAVGTHGRGAFVGTFSTNTAIAAIPQLPSKFNLEQNYPNPFNPTTNISYTLPSEAHVTLTVYDLTGRKVAELLTNKLQSMGSHMYTFDASKLASGMYFYRMQVSASNGNGSAFTQTRKMILLK